MPDPDPDTVEAIARWLEEAHTSYTMRPILGRELADQLRTGRWQTMPAVRDTTQIALGRLDDKLRAGLPLTAAEQLLNDRREQNRARRALAEANALTRAIDEMERHANRGTPPCP
jgi:hypothetical protein